jgi:hypothetical protein
MQHIISTDCVLIQTPKVSKLLAVLSTGQLPSANHYSVQKIWTVSSANLSFDEISSVDHYFVHGTASICQSFLPWDGLSLSIIILYMGQLPSVRNSFHEMAFLCQLLFCALESSHLPIIPSMRWLISVNYFSVHGAASPCQSFLPKDSFSLLIIILWTIKFPSANDRSSNPSH